MIFLTYIYGEKIIFNIKLVRESWMHLLEFIAHQFFAYKCNWEVAQKRPGRPQENKENKSGKERSKPTTQCTRGPKMFSFCSGSTQP